MVPSTGRPRNADLDVALIRAVETLILDKGFSGISVGAVAAQAKTTRPAFYRRFDGIPHLVLAFLLERFAIDLDRFIDSGNLPADLEAIQRDQLELFSNPLVHRSLAGFLDSLQSDAELRDVFVEEFLKPRRAGVGIIIQRALARGEIAPNPDTEWVCDLLTGPFLMRVLMPGLNKLDDSLISSTVTAALQSLGYRSP